MSGMLRIGPSCVLIALLAGRIEAGDRYAPDSGVVGREPVGSQAADNVSSRGKPTVDENLYGGISPAKYVLQAYAFDPFIGDGANIIANGSGSRGCTSDCFFEAPVMLPAGAIIEAIEFEACDNDPAAHLVATLVHLAQLETSTVLLGSVATVTGAGCAVSTLAIVPAHVVNNDTGTYVMQVFTNGDTLDTRFQAVRLVYRLQVSPAPANATFPGDVPTNHPFFRFVEALAASGITGGCGANSFCPDSPVTRGQMAVFLATALGLHFPN